ncbi:paralemmin-3 [Rhinophrynus dorsalis]
MGETLIYNQRLNEITERRNILGEVEKIQRELEQKRLVLKQLKRKSLRERWLMDGLVPSPGTDIDNPLSETEVKIKHLEDELTSLQTQLMRLQNPSEDQKEEEVQANNANAERDQQATAQTGSSGDGGMRRSDDPHEDSKEVNQLTETLQPARQDLGLGTGTAAGHPIPAPRGKTPGKPAQSQRQVAQDQNLEHSILERLNHKEENKTQSLEHQDLNPEHQNLEKADQFQKHKEQDLEQIYQVEEHKEQNLEQFDQIQESETEHPGKDHQEHVKGNQIHQSDVSEHVNCEKQNLEHLDKTLALQVPNKDNQKYSQDVLDQHPTQEKEISRVVESAQSLLQENQKKQNQSPEPGLLAKEQTQSQENITVTTDQKQNLEPISLALESIKENIQEIVPTAEDKNLERSNPSVSTICDQSQGENEESILLFKVQTQDLSQEPITLSENQNLLLLCKDQNQDQGSALAPEGQGLTQSISLSSKEQGMDLILPSKDQNELPTLPSVDKNEIPILSFKDQNELPVLPLKDHNEFPTLPSKDQNEFPTLPFKNLNEFPTLPSTDQNEFPTLLSEDQNEFPTLSSKDQNEFPTPLSNDQNEFPTLVSKDQIEVLTLPSKGWNEIPTLLSKDQNEFPTLLSKDQNEVLTLPSKGQNEIPTLLSKDQNEFPTLLSKDQNEFPTLLSKDQNELPTLLSKDQNEVLTLPSKGRNEIPTCLSKDQNQLTHLQSSQVVQVSTHVPEVVQHSTSNQTAPSVHPQPSTSEGNPIPECQPLLQKPQGTDTCSGANTAESQGESTPVKKKSCQCCVVM